MLPEDIHGKQIIEGPCSVVLIENPRSWPNPYTALLCLTQFIYVPKGKSKRNEALAFQRYNAAAKLLYAVVLHGIILYKRSMAERRLGTKERVHNQCRSGTLTNCTCLALWRAISQQFNKLLLLQLEK